MRATAARRLHVILTSTIWLRASSPPARPPRKSRPQVASIQGITADTRGAIDAIATTLTEISGIMSGIEVDTDKQRNSTQDISRSVQDAARGTLEVSNHIGQITASSAETGRMAGEARDAATELSQQAETLKREVDDFIRNVKAS